VTVRLVFLCEKYKTAKELFILLLESWTLHVNLVQPKPKYVWLLIVLSKKLPDQLGLNCYAVSTHPYELVLEPPLKKSWIRLCRCAAHIQLN